MPPDASLIDHRGRKYLTNEERLRFLDAARAHPKPTAAKLTDFLLPIAHQMQNHYCELLSRYNNRADERQPDLWADTDPPF